MTRVLPFLACWCLAQPATAANTTGVFGPIVNAGHSAFEYRGTFDLGNDNLAQRIHYQQSLNEDFMWRTVLATRTTVDSEFDFDFFQAELFWDLSEDGDAWRTGLRFDLLLGNEDRANLFGVHWTNQYNFNDDWSARFLAMTTLDFGENAREGIFLQTRASITRRVTEALSVGAEVYNVYGQAENFVGFVDQSHQIGPVVTYTLEDQWTIYGGVLFGLSERDSEPQLRLWITKAF